MNVVVFLHGCLGCWNRKNSVSVTQAIVVARIAVFRVVSAECMFPLGRLGILGISQLFHNDSNYYNDQVETRLNNQLEISQDIEVKFQNIFKQQQEYFDKLIQDLDNFYNLQIKEI